MKVALISPLDYRSGISKYSHNLFRALLEIGVDVTLFYQAEKIYPPAERDENIKEIKRKDASTILGKFDIVHFQLGNSEFHHFQNHILGEIFNIKTKKIATFHEEELRFFNLKCAECWGSIGVQHIFNIFKKKLSEE